MVSRGWLTGAGLLALLIFVVLSYANLNWGDLNQDEGWYLYAAGEVSEGRLPYRDFAFTQPPMLPIVYAFAQPLVDFHGVAGGRFFTCFIGFLTLLATSALGARTVPRNWQHYAIVLTMGLLATNVYQSYFTTIVKTYSLCSFFLILGLLMLSYARKGGGALFCMMGGVLLAFATATRMSAGMAVPLVGLYLLIERRDLGWNCLTGFILGAGLAAAAVFGPFFVMAPESFMFSLFEYHTSRSAGAMSSLLVYKGGFVSRVVAAYFVVILLWLLLFVFHAVRGRRYSEAAQESPCPERFAGLLWSVVIGITGLHLAAPFPYDDYQVIVFPVFVAAVASASTRLLADYAIDLNDVQKGYRIRVPATVLLIVAVLGSTASAFSSPINQDWFVLGRDRIWWNLKEKSDVKSLQEVGAWLDARLGRDDVLLTQDTYLAVEAGVRVPHGLEMGPFAYYPDWSRERATKLHVLNRDMMRDLIDHGDARMAAFSGYGLALKGPEVSELDMESQQDLWDRVNARYRKLFEVPYFGQAHTKLQVLVLDE